MGYASIGLVAIAFLALWLRERDARRELGERLADRYREWLAAREERDQRISALEGEILRLRKIPLTAQPSRDDNSVVRAKSAAEVRQLTEAAWGLKPGIGEERDDSE